MPRIPLRSMRATGLTMSQRMKRVDNRIAHVHDLFGIAFFGRRMFLVQNERTKLTASWLNALATALIAAGAFAPIAAWLYGLSALPVEALNLTAIAFACVGAGFTLHLSALALLGRLRE